MQYYSKFFLLSCYRSIALEYLLKKYEQFCYSYAIEKTFGMNKEMQQILNDEIHGCLSGLGVEFKVLNFIFKNNKRIKIENLSAYFDSVAKKAQSEEAYFQQLFDHLREALDMELANKFYKPRGGFSFHQKDDIFKHIAYLKGFSFDQIKFMLFLEGVYDLDIEGEILDYFTLLDEMNRSLKDIVEDDTSVGVFEENGEVHCTIPRICDEESSYLAVYNIIRYELIRKRAQIGDDAVVYSDELPIFYEYLFKGNYLSPFSECEPMHKWTAITLKLLDTYETESFDEQIEKVKRIKYES